MEHRSVGCKCNHWPGKPRARKNQGPLLVVIGKISGCWQWFYNLWDLWSQGWYLFIEVVATLTSHHTDAEMVTYDAHTLVALEGGDKNWKGGQFAGTAGGTAKSHDACECLRVPHWHKTHSFFVLLVKHWWFMMLLWSLETVSQVDLKISLDIHRYSWVAFKNQGQQRYCSHLQGM